MPEVYGRPHGGVNSPPAAVAAGRPPRRGKSKKDEAHADPLGTLVEEGETSRTWTSTRETPADLVSSHERHGPRWGSNAPGNSRPPPRINGPGKLSIIGQNRAERARNMLLISPKKPNNILPSNTSNTVNMGT
jgi:hypothetical protein